MKQIVLASLLAVTLLMACNQSEQPTVTSEEFNSTNSEVVLASEIEWGYLNPLRGDKSPGAADVWGDRTKDVASGILVKFNKGFSSPPHIHNITYRGVVIKGLLHNDDPKAENMWLPTGSFWIQPAGETHITAANGEENLAYIEIDSGPYLVLPEEEAFDNGERPVNVDKTNLVWLDADNIRWVNQSENDKNGAKVAFLWGELNPGKVNGTMVKLPAGFQGEIKAKGSEFRAIVIKGQLEYQNATLDATKVLDPSSYFGSEGNTIHKITNTKEESVIYIRTNGNYEIVSNNEQ